LRTKTPIQCCCFGSWVPGAEFYNEVKTIDYNHSMASIPDDMVAYQAALGAAQVAGMRAGRHTALLIIIQSKTKNFPEQNDSTFRE